MTEARRRPPSPATRRRGGISEPFIRRPVATTLLMIGLLLVGHHRLPRSCRSPRCRRSTTRRSSSSTSLPGASAETMASAVTTPLERQFGQVPSLAQMTSRVELRQLADHAAVHARSRHRRRRSRTCRPRSTRRRTCCRARCRRRRPTRRATRPTSRSSRSRSARTTLPLAQVDDFADSVLAQKISQVSGVGLVTIGGGQKPAVRVQVDPVALAGTGLTLEDVRTALAAANVNQPKGNLDGPRQDWAIATNDQLDNADGVRAARHRVQERRADPARATSRTSIDGVENAQLAGWAGDAARDHRQRPAPAGREHHRGHRRDQGAAAAAARRRCRRRSTSQILADRTETVRASVDDVKFTLVLTIVLVVAVIYLFLGSARATIIPGVAVPLSLIGTFGVMQLVRASRSTTCR